MLINHPAPSPYSSRTTLELAPRPPAIIPEPWSEFDEHLNQVSKRMEKFESLRHFQIDEGNVIKRMGRKAMTLFNVGPTKAPGEISSGAETTESGDFSTDRSDGSKRPDMSWILATDSNETASEEDFDKSARVSISELPSSLLKYFDKTEKPSSLDETPQLFSDIRRVLQLVIILGRFPFVIYADTRIGTFQCKMKRRIYRFDLYLLTIITTLALFTCSLSVFQIFVSQDANGISVETLNKDRSGVLAYAYVLNLTTTLNS